MAVHTTIERRIILWQTAEQKGTGNIFIKLEVRADAPAGSHEAETITATAKPDATEEIAIADLPAQYGITISSAATLKARTNTIVVDWGGGGHTEVDNT